MNLYQQTDRGYGNGDQEVSRERGGDDLVLQGNWPMWHTCQNYASNVGYVGAVDEEMLKL